MASAPSPAGAAASVVPVFAAATKKRTAVRKPTAKKKTSTRKSRRRRPSAASLAAAAKAKELASTKVAEQIGEPTNEYLEQPGALVPFFEQLYRQENRLNRGPVRVLQFGDSHTAAHFWTSTVRGALQSRFGNGGSGFIHAGKPWVGYRRFDVATGASPGWHSEGLVGKPSQRGDEFQGLGGVSVQATRAGSWISLDATCSTLEIQYLQQPGGGLFRLYDSGELVAEQSTDGELGPGILQLSTFEGPHEFKIVTATGAPVKLYGWVTEEPLGVTYEPLGISGANASITSRWNRGLFQHFLARRDPALIVVAYGSNEAGQLAWTYEKYFEEFDALLKKIRAASPAASLLVVGPPDRLWYQRRGGWKAAPRMDVVVRAQRDAARANRAAYWDTQTRMGGPGSMREWVRAGLAARDYVHFSADGYRRLGDVLYRDLMVQYNEFKTLRNEWSASSLYDRTPAKDPQPDQQGLQEE
ncbi:MAG: GDSL-type esterase/lipase family protein [Bryobacterales bacterium]|nr:GDSL-type esterase/lipase family protein [Bryobacterales bacterium]